MLIAAQVESLGVNGVALVKGADAIGFRGAALLSPVGRFDHNLTLATLKEMGPYDPQGRYGHVAFAVPVAPDAVRDFLRFEHFGTNTPFVFDFDKRQAAIVDFQWAFDGRQLVAKFQSTLPLDFVVFFNGCVATADVVAATSGGAAMRQGQLEAHLGFDRQAAAFASASSDEHAEVCLRGLEWKGKSAGKLTAHRFSLSPQSPLCMALGESPVQVSAADVDKALQHAMGEMQAGMMDSSGAATDCADAIGRCIGYGRSYDTRRQHTTVAVNRSWAGPNGHTPIFLWDNVFISAMAGLYSPELAKESMGHILEFLDQDVAAAPPQRNLVVPIVYSKAVRFLGDREFAERTYGSMMKLVRFFFDDRGDGHPWRDGNDDGLIECGSCMQPGQAPLGTIIQNAFDETGYDDSPMYSAGFAYKRAGLPADDVEFDFARGTLNLTMVGQNCLYVAACRSMAVVARWLDKQADADWLESQAKGVAERVTKRLFSPAHGIFMNRFFNGEFSPVKTPDIFTPLLADVADQSVSERLKAILTDPAQFWGDNIVPTVSRDDPAYGDEARHDPYWKGNYWRGNVWAPTNYIVYLAIRHACWDDVTADFAQKCRDLFMNDWRKRHHAMENYPPQGTTDRTHLFYGNGGREPHYTWSALLALITLEELFAVEEVTDGLRFGTLEGRSFGTWRNFRFHGKPSSIDVGPGGVHLVVQGELEFHSDVPVAVRRFVASSGGGSFRYSSAAPAKVRIVCGALQCEASLTACKDGPFEFSFRK